MRTGIAFSGGKDSWALLWLHQSELIDMPVIWIDTGKNIPEVLESVERAKALCPEFYHFQIDQEGQTREKGLPSDVVPIDWTPLGQAVTGKKPVTIQSYLECCAYNISFPLAHYAKELKLDQLLVGQKASDHHRGLRRDGDMVEGIQYLHPLEDWTDEQVLTYLSTKMELPPHFALKHTSVDCYDCTAYGAETADKVEFIRSRHPKLHEEYRVRLEAVQQALKAAGAR